MTEVIDLDVYLPAGSRILAEHTADTVRSMVLIELSVQMSSLDTYLVAVITEAQRLRAAIGNGVIPTYPVKMQSNSENLAPALHVGFALARILRNPQLGVTDADLAATVAGTPPTDVLADIRARRQN